MINFKTMMFPVITLVLLAANCSRHPYIPPGDILELDSPLTLNKKEYALSGAVGEAGAIFDYSILSGWLRIKYGISDRLEIGLKGSGIYLLDHFQTFERYHPYSIGTHISFKYSLLPRFVSADGGVGYGFSDLGHYINGDIGLIVGFENRYLVPFSHISTFVGIPINPRTYDLSETNEYRGFYFYTPSPTSGASLNFGLKFPVTSWFIKNDNAVSVSVTAGTTYVSDQTKSQQFLIGGFSAEYRLKRKMVD